MHRTGHWLSMDVHDVAITEPGNEVLTDAAPKTVADIEELMRT